MGIMETKWILAALRARRDLTRLGESELAHLSLVSVVGAQQPQPDSVAMRGWAVRRLLLAALEQLRPDPGPEDGADPRWFRYLILQRQYVMGDPVDLVRVALGRTPDGLPLRTYHRYRERALEELGQILLDWELQWRRVLAAGSDATYVPDTSQGRDSPASVLAPASLAWLVALQVR